MKLTRILSVFVLALVVAACGGESSDQQAAQETETTEQARTIEIIGLNSLKFAVEENVDGITVGEQVGTENNLLRLETITAEPGEEITIELTTQSQLPASAMAHNWVLLALDADVAAFAQAAAQAKDNDYVPADQTDQIIAQTGLAGGGETTSVTFTVPSEPGEYEYVCTFPGHFQANMRGTLIVKG